MKQGTRICKGCKIDRPWSEYFRGAYSAYLHHFCKDCVRKEKAGVEKRIINRTARRDSGITVGRKPPRTGAR